MARAIHLWLPSLTAFALCACSGSDSGFFSPVVTAGTGDSISSAGSPGSADGSGGAGSAVNSAGSPGQEAAGDGSGGEQTGGTSSGGPAGAPSGGTASGSAGSSAHAGAGARAGAGGSGASAGHAGSNSGSAGVGGTAQDLSCSELIKLANQQLATARECDPDAKAVQCTGTVTTPCHCEVPVQKDTSSASKAYLNTLKELEQKKCVQVCTAIACLAVGSAECSKTSGSATGVCVATTRSIGSTPGPGP